MTANTPAMHREVSARLVELAGVQRQALLGGEFLGVPVYAGGDDLLTFVPARTALAAAVACRRLVPVALPSASTAIVFFHYHASLQGAMNEARALLEQAKSQIPGKNALAVGYLRRSGTAVASIQPWPGPDGSTMSADLFRIFTAEAGHGLSPRLVADLDRDAGELERLSVVSEDLYQAELARLVRRHSRRDSSAGQDSAARPAAALAWLGRHEAAGENVPPRRSSRPQLAARVGVFLWQEAR